MRDPRGARLAQLIVQRSTCLQPGEAVLIESFDLADGLVLDLVDAAHAAGALPLVSVRSNAVIRSQLARAAANIAELADVPSDRMSLYQQLVAQPVHLDYRVNHTRWVVLRYPNAAMAQLANMSTEQFDDFYFRVCTLDYPRMADAMEPLKRRMERTDRVRIKGPGTDLRFSTKGIPAVTCEGRRKPARWRVLHRAGA